MQLNSLHARQVPTTNGFNAEAGIGNYGSYRTGFSVGHSFNDAISGSVALQATGYDGYSTNIATGESLGKEENYAARIKLHYHGIEGFDAVAMISYTDSESNGLPLLNGTTPTVPLNQQFEFDDVVITSGNYRTNRPSGNKFPLTENKPRGDTEQLIASLDMSWDLGANVTIRSITGYVDTIDEIVTDFAGTGLVMFDDFFGYPPSQPRATNIGHAV